MLLPPILAAVFLLLAGSLVCRSLLPLPVAAALLLGDAAFATRKVRRQGLPLSYFDVLLAKGRAAGSLGYYLGYHLLRYYLIPLLLTGMLYPPFGLLVVAIALGVSGVDYRVRKARLSPILFFLYSLLESLSYGAGAFWGCVRTKSFASYRLEVKNVSEAF